MAEVSKTNRADPDSSRTPQRDDFELLVASVVDYAIFMLDPSGIVTTWNLGAERLKGYCADLFHGRHQLCPSDLRRSQTSARIGSELRDIRALLTDA